MKNSVLQIVVTPAELAKLNLVCTITGENQKTVVMDLLNTRFTQIQPQIQTFEARIKRFNELRGLVGIKRVYRKRKTLKRKAK